MALDASEVTLDVDAAPAEDLVIAIDPIELEPVGIVEPLPAEYVGDDLGDVPPEGETVDGPIDEPVDVSTDAPADSTAGDGAGDAPADEDLIFTTTFIDDSPVDPILVEEDVPADGGDADVGIIFGDVPDDGTVYTMDETGTLIERPSDPEPNWRTFDGEGEGGGGAVVGAEGGTDGAGDTGSDPVIEEVSVKDPAVDDGSETPDDVIYTLDPNDPLIYATTSSGETPGRPTDPLPFERGNAAPAVDLTAPDTASDVVHYAASEPFHTGLDLL